MASRHRGVGAEDHQASYDQPAWGRATKAPPVILVRLHNWDSNNRSCILV